MKLFKICSREAVEVHLTELPFQSLEKGGYSRVGMKQCPYVLKTKSLNGSELRNNAAKMKYLENCFKPDHFSDIFRCKSSLTVPPVQLRGLHMKGGDQEAAKKKDRKYILFCFCQNHVLLQPWSGLYLLCVQSELTE